MKPLKKVLLVDDSDLVASMVGQALEDAGMTVVRGANGVEGVELAYREVPDVIVMDAEMPLMQGYLASRLLKSRRGVRDIPIIMHTSLTEDRDKYWALASGTDEFAEKNFDNVDALVERVAHLAEHLPLDVELIREDGARINRDRVFELLGAVLDQQLFQSTIANLLAKVARTMDSLADTVGQVLDLVPKVTESHLAVVLLPWGKAPRAYLRASDKVHQKDCDEFLRVCLGDFHESFPTIDLGAVEGHCVGEPPTGAPGRPFPLNSYHTIPLYGRGDAVVATLHLGHGTNNYFSENIVSNIEVFARTAGIILDNAVLFHRTSEMQKRVRSAFNKFVPHEIIDQLIETTQSDVRLVGEKREVAILFSDIRSFTTISENNSAEDVVAFLNRHFEIMGGIVKNHGGTIDKFIGDAILAVFGAPISYEDNALRAAQAALAMVEALPRVEVSSLEMPPGGLRIGVGIHHGQAIIGNIGSVDKFDYTVVGDTVNLASRLEGLTKVYHQTVLVSDAVRVQIGDQLAVREIDTVRVMGRETPTTLWGVVTSEDPCPAPFLEEFSKALKMYRLGNWSTALDYFQRARTLKPTDAATGLFLERCARFLDTPPADWDGALDMDTK